MLWHSIQSQGLGSALIGGDVGPRLKLTTHNADLQEVGNA